MRLHHIPPRMACGAFILNTGMTKRSLDLEGAAGMGIARDVFMLGSGLGLLLEEITDRGAKRSSSTETQQW